MTKDKHGVPGRRLCTDEMLVSLEAAKDALSRGDRSAGEPAMDPRAAGVRGDDIVINLVEMPKENWSFGRGELSYPPAAPSNTR
jgi:hypothetical protein